VPIPPELVRIMSEHIATFELAEAAGCFAVRRVVCCRRLPTELSGVRLANPPDSRAVRLAVGTSAVRLRHAGISLWLNAGVAATEVARRAGHSVAALLQVYANCIDREGWTYNERIERALRPVGEQAEGFNRDRLAGASGEPNEKLWADRGPLWARLPLISTFAHVRRARLVADGGGLEKRWAPKQHIQALSALRSENLG
jgi:hypothetical protein